MLEAAKRIHDVETKQHSASAGLVEAKRARRELLQARKNLEGDLLEKESDIAILKQKLQSDITEWVFWVAVVRSLRKPVVPPPSLAVMVLDGWLGIPAS